MNTTNKRRICIFCVVLFLCSAIAFLYYAQDNKENKSSIRDYAEISSEGVLRVATEYNSISYHIVDDTIEGFDYELIQAFAHDKGLRLEVMPDMSFEHRLNGLKAGIYDIITCGIATSNEMKDTLPLTTPIARNKWILIQRKDSTQINTQLKLANCTLAVVKGSPARLRIRNLSEEIGDTIYINEIEKYGQEQLMPLVAHGDIDYAVVDQGIANALIDSFPQIDTHIDIGFTQFYSWAVNKNAPALLDSLNKWLEHFLQREEYRNIYKKYF